MKIIYRASCMLPTSISVLWISLSADVPSEKRRPPKNATYIIAEPRCNILSYFKLPPVLNSIFPRTCFFRQLILAILIFHHLSQYYSLILGISKPSLSWTPTIFPWILSFFYQLSWNFTQVEYFFSREVWDGRGSTGHLVLVICCKPSLFIMNQMFCSMAWL